jgi:hypothetical protein
MLEAVHLAGVLDVSDEGVHLLGYYARVQTMVELLAQFAFGRCTTFAKDWDPPTSSK